MSPEYSAFHVMTIGVVIGRFNDCFDSLQHGKIFTRTIAEFTLSREYYRFFLVFRQGRA